MANSVARHGVDGARATTLTKIGHHLDIPARITIIIDEVTRRQPRLSEHGVAEPTDGPARAMDSRGTIAILISFLGLRASAQNGTLGHG